MAELCRAAGADEALIPRRAEEGQRRTEAKYGEVPAPGFGDNSRA